MAKLNNFRVFSFAKLHSVIFGFLGLILGVLYSFGGFVIDTLVSLGLVSEVTASTPGLSFGTILAFGALIGMPVIFAVVGFLIGFFEGIILKIILKLFKKIKLKL